MNSENQFTNSASEFIKIGEIQSGIPADVKMSLQISASGAVNSEHNRYYVASLLRDLANQLETSATLNTKNVDMAIMGLIKNRG